MPKSWSVIPKQCRCEYCKREFSDELRLIDHICEKKRRWFQKDQPQGRMAFMAWSRFYELNSQVTGKKNQRTYKDFINSRYYLAFNQFARHLLDTAAPEPARFIDYVLKSNLPITRWTHDLVYAEYVKTLIRTETPEQALERGVILMREWAQQHDLPWHEFFKNVNTNQVANWVRTGRLSPWILYNASSAEHMLERCNAEQLNIIAAAAPVAQWTLKFRADKEGTAFVRDTLKKAGL
jgi:hypothetical protein